MAGLFIKLFIGHAEKNGAASQADKRNAYGTACGVLGIFLNVLLFLAKFTVGLLSGSVAITADAFNNLADHFRFPSCGEKA